MIGIRARLGGIACRYDGSFSGNKITGIWTETAYFRLNGLKIVSDTE